MRHMPVKTHQTPTASLDSAAVARLMEEVRNGVATSVDAYNRMHNRHNR